MRGKSGLRENRVMREPAPFNGCHCFNIKGGKYNFQIAQWFYCKLILNSTKRFQLRTHSWKNEKDHHQPSYSLFSFLHMTVVVEKDWTICHFPFWWDGMEHPFLSIILNVIYKTKIEISLYHIACNNCKHFCSLDSYL